jgi:hypothetical protein
MKRKLGGVMKAVISKFFSSDTIWHAVGYFGAATAASAAMFGIAAHVMGPKHNTVSFNIVAESHAALAVRQSRNTYVEYGVTIEANRAPDILQRRYEIIEKARLVLNNPEHALTRAIQRASLDSNQAEMVANFILGTGAEISRIGENVRGETLVMFRSPIQFPNGIEGVALVIPSGQNFSSPRMLMVSPTHRLQETAIERLPWETASLRIHTTGATRNNINAGQTPMPRM